PPRSSSSSVRSLRQRPPAMPGTFLARLLRPCSLPPAVGRFGSLAHGRLYPYDTEYAHGWDAGMSVRHALLALLSEGPKYGLQLRQEFVARTGEVWPLNVGQVYTTLQRLERDGLVESVGEE